MQPTQRFKKTLLAGALLLGTCNAFNASADLFPVTAGAIPDVTAGFVSGYTELSFGTGLIGNKVGLTCTMNGITGISDDAMKWSVLGTATNDIELSTYGALGGTGACLTSDPGVPMVIEIDAADTSTVTVTVADVVGAGYTYTPTAQSCVIDFTRTNVADVCEPLTNNTVTGVGMSSTISADGAGAVEDVASIYEFAAISGKTRMVLAGQITIDSEIAAGTAIADSVIVQVTYE